MLPAVYKVIETLDSACSDSRQQCLTWTHSTHPEQQQQQKTEDKDHGENNLIMCSLADMDNREDCLCQL